MLVGGDRSFESELEHTENGIHRSTNVYGGRREEEGYIGGEKRTKRNKRNEYEVLSSSSSSKCIAY